MKKAVIGGATAAVALIVVLKQFLPDLMRYLRIRRM
ncbi:hypothetical protein [Streptomyces sp. ISL-86]